MSLGRELELERRVRNLITEIDKAVNDPDSTAPALHWLNKELDEALEEFTDSLRGETFYDG